MQSVAAFLRPFALAGALLIVAGCGMLPDKVDETAKWTPEKMYTEAKDLLRAGSYDQAVKMFEKLEARYPYGRYAQQSQLEVAYAHYRMLEPETAIADCDRFIRLHPNHPNVDYAYYLKGLVNFNEDHGLMGYISQQDPSERDPKAAKDSYDAFRALVLRFPESRYAADSRARMKYLVNALAQHEVHVARYYLNRRAPIAAVNRAKTAITGYPDSPATEEALYIMVLAYQDLGMKDLRDDAERVLRKNFPQSRFAAQGFASDVPWWKLW